MKMWLVRNLDNSLKVFNKKPKCINRVWQSIDVYGTVDYGISINIKSKITFNKSPKLVNI